MGDKSHPYNLHPKRYLIGYCGRKRPDLTFLIVYDKLPTIFDKLFSISGALIVHNGELIPHNRELIPNNQRR